MISKMLSQNFSYFRSPNHAFPPVRGVCVWLCYFKGMALIFVSGGISPVANIMGFGRVDFAKFAPAVMDL